ncbi:non-hydrolyzing UDP-N-acetylglucosamine 2-epimerase [Helicobacter canis]|uniref:UDP-N-acetylglucosamine 2-epimerase (non-hydrolyzing) n=1 Tax=Helicobacter canis TaxID=29419 RepID=A0A377J4B5_9HELI|nr:UDP-N-acetylglucosamine 2-epimerase (non-hydrolyzing) [Helicobacter canis]STO97301.1 UDP-N-acetylglucosamine 2-epimerase [Helicobacter canis]
MQTPLESNAFTKAHILIIRSNPCDPDSRVQKIATSLAKQRAKVRVLAWDRNSAQNSRATLTPQTSHILIDRLGIKASYGVGLRNLLPLLLFQVKVLAYLWANRKTIDAIHACDLDTALPALCIAKLCKKPLIYDIFDYYVDTFNVPRILKPLIKSIETFVINHSDECIICAQSRLEQIAPSKPRSLSIIHNAPEKPAYIKPFALLDSKAKRVKIAYVGVLCHNRYLLELLELIAADPRLELHIAGFGILQDVVESYAARADNISFYGKICYEDTLALESACDIITALYDPSVPNHLYAAPNKFYESLLLGKPVVMVKGTGMSEIVEAMGIGAVIDFSLHNLKQAFISLAASNSPQLQAKRQALYKEQFAWGIMEQRLWEIYARFFPNLRKSLIAVIFGTRPEAIKLAPLIKQLESSEHFAICTITSGQHTDSMLSPILQAFAITPSYNLHIHAPHQSLESISYKLLYHLSPLLKTLEPDLLCIHGDTTTAYISALCGFYQHIPIAHIEAGLRTHNIHSPFPEEFNRQAIALIATYHFTPTNTTKAHLLNERVAQSSIFVVGNTAIDALQTTIASDFTHPLLEWLGTDKCLLLTAHRRENLGKNLARIFSAINALLESIPNLKIIYPIHPNPAIQASAQKHLKSQERLRIVPPLDVIAFHNLLHRADIILTDSGGIQEEAPALHKPVLVLRESTERVEGLEAGTLKLVGTDPSAIFEAVYELLHNQALYAAMASKKNPYGNGTSSKQITSILENLLGGAELGYRIYVFVDFSLESTFSKKDSACGLESRIAAPRCVDRPPSLISLRGLQSHDSSHTILESQSGVVQGGGTQAGFFSKAQSSKKAEPLLKVAYVAA